MSYFYKHIFKNKKKSILILYFLVLIGQNLCDDEGTRLNTMEFKYLNCIELNNGKVLIFFENGIYIYNSELSQEINNFGYQTGLTFSDDNDLNLINLSKFDDGIVVSIIKTYLYIFSSAGECLYNTDLKEDLEGASYYSLVPHKIDGNNYYYAIAYISSSSKLKIYYYSFNIDNKTNTQIDYLEYSHSDSNYEIYDNNNGLTCELMSPLNSEKILTCFYAIANPYALAATSFYLNNSISQCYSMPIIYLSNIQPGYFKSDVNNDKTKALICYSASGTGGRCTFYNINNNTFSEDKKYFNSCQNQPKGIHVDYFEKAKEFIFSCSDTGSGLTIMKFDENENAIEWGNSAINKNYNFQSTLYSYSILFLPKYPQYSIIFTTKDDAKCNHYLLPSKFNPSTIYEITEGINTDELVTRTSYITTTSSFISTKTSLITKKTSLKSSIMINKNTEFYSSLIDLTSFSKSTVFEKETDFFTENENINDYQECSTFKNGDIKCLYCNEESLKLNKCIECNNKLGYYPVIYNNKEEKYKKCYNEKTKINYFYFDLNSFKVCYELCQTCDNGGNGIENNCTSCISGYMLKPETIPPTNCVYECKYYYYYSDFDQYRCTDNGQCPEERNLLVRTKSKCINNCNDDLIYKYQYNSECLQNCPDNTFPNEFKICEDNNINICSLSNFESDLSLDEIKTNNIELSAINYAKEYSYTNNHISQFNNKFYSYILYKNSDCIDKLSLNFSTIDFGSCYNKIKSYYNITNELIISITNVKSEVNKPVTLYEIFNPETGNKINIESICENQTIIIKENLLNYLKPSKLFILEQNIDIFDLNGSFYKDICFHFESPNGKDVPLRDRILSFFPNITLCDNGCDYQGFDLESLQSICECKITNFLDNYLTFNDFPFLENMLGDILDLIKESNILVLKCYKDLFHSKYYKKNKGFFISISLICIQIISTIVFIYRDLLKIKKYIFNISKDFIIYINKKKDNIKYSPPIKAKGQIKNKHNKKISLQLSCSGLNESKSNNKIVIYNYKKHSSSNYFFLNKNGNRFKSFVLNQNNIINTNKDGNLINPNKKNLKSKIIFSTNNIKKEEDTFKEYLMTSLDDLDFEEAIEKDKRKFYEIFIDLIKDEHLIIKTFFISDNIRPRSIKILLFDLFIDLYFVTNALMYNEEYISELFNSNKEENFFFFLKNSIGRLISVSIIGALISYLIEYFFIDEKKLKRIFIKNRRNKDIKYKVTALIKYIEEKYKLFIIISYIITVISWYYIFCFNNVYPNTSINWIKSTIFLIILIQLIKFGYILLESLLRQMSFICKSEIIFHISHLLSN